MPEPGCQTNNKRWGEIDKLAKTTECFKEANLILWIYTHWYTFSRNILWSFSILLLPHVCTLCLKKMTRTPTHANLEPHMHTHKHTQNRAEWSMKLWFKCYGETWQFLLFELAVKCISQIKCQISLIKATELNILFVAPRVNILWGRDNL